MELGFYKLGVLHVTFITMAMCAFSVCATCILRATSSKVNGMGNTASHVQQYMYTEGYIVVAFLHHANMYV